MVDSAKASSPPPKSPPPAAALSPAKSPASPVKSPPAATFSSPPMSPASAAAAALSPTPLADALDVDENPEEDHYDLGIDFSGQSDTASLNSSILKYRQENGRTYHAYKDGSYLIPNDDMENERLDLQHTIFQLTWDGKLHVAPLGKEPRRVLDAGCGTGVWAIDFADEHPESHVTGTDLSPIQPAFVPPNLEFFVDDVEDDWNFSTPFDFVFARFMTGSIGNWPRFFKQAYDNLAPGGTIEIQDIIFPISCDDGTLPDDCDLVRLDKLLNTAFGKTNRSMDSALQYQRQLTEAGFIDGTVVQEKWPMSHWPKDKKYKQIGIWNSENLAEAFSAASLAIFTRSLEEGGLGWSRTEVEVLLAGARKDIRNPNYHSYLRLNAYYATKPETAV